MNKYGLLGYPLGHSFSRKFFLDKFEKEGIVADFLNYEFENAKDVIEVVKSDDTLKGFAVTIPHKQNIIEFLDETDEAINSIGAVNCVKISRNNDETKLKGFNTDVIGFEESLKEFLKPEHKKALILGAGGASKAVAHVLGKLGITYALVDINPTGTVLDYSEINAEVMRETRLIINATPLGMHPKVDTCPNIPYDRINENHYCYDLVYNPKETLFLKKAKLQGAAIKSGMDMLELQAEANWRIWNEE